MESNLQNASLVKPMVSVNRNFVMENGKTYKSPG